MAPTVNAPPRWVSRIPVSSWTGSAATGPPTFHSDNGLLGSRYLQACRLNEALLRRYVSGSRNIATASFIGSKLPCRFPHFTPGGEQGRPLLASSEVCNALIALGVGESFLGDVERRLTSVQQIHIRVYAQVSRFGFLLVLELIPLPLIRHPAADEGPSHTAE